MTWVLIVITVTVLIGLLFAGFSVLKDQSTRTGTPSGHEWPLLAKTGERNQAYMIKALLDDANIDCIVEEDTTLGILYGAQSITDYPIRVPEHKLQESRGLLKESSFSTHLVEHN